MRAHSRSKNVASLASNILRKTMDCRVKPGNDETAGA
jgi:hypothetical protein